MYLSQKERKAFSLSKMLIAMNTDTGLAGSLEAEVLSDAASAVGESFDGHRVHLPLELLTRDMSVGLAANSGAQLVGTDATQPFDAVGNFSVTRRLGAQFLPGLVGNVDIPTLSFSTGGTWQDGESDSLNEETGTTGKQTLTPKTAGMLVDFSRQLKLQASIDTLLARFMLTKLGNMLDLAVIDGTGANGQPTGLLNASAIGTVTGTSFTWAGALQMEASAATAAGDLPLAFVGHPDARQLLAARAKGTDAGFIWADRRISDVDAYVSAAAPSKSLIVGPWSTVYVGLWGDKLTIEVNPFANFQTGMLSARMMLDCDVGLPAITMFSKTESLT